MKLKLVQYIDVVRVCSILYVGIGAFGEMVLGNS